VTIFFEKRQKIVVLRQVKVLGFEFKTGECMVEKAKLHTH